jgi:hypothetical protein
MEFAMHKTYRAVFCLLALAPILTMTGAAGAAPLPANAAGQKPASAAIQVYDGSWYEYLYDDDVYGIPPPPPPPVRYVPAPPIVVYEPPVYGWIAPPRPMSCGKYRYWNGEYCADARREPPYTGPR